MLRFVLGASLAISATGCVPKDAALSPDSILASINGSGSTQFQGFTGLTKVQTMSSSKVQLTWAPSTDASVVAYEVYDASANIISPPVVATVNAPTSTTSIIHLNPCQLYTFRVRGMTADGSTDSNTSDLHGIPYGGVASVGTITATTAQINFNDASNADQVQILCKVGVAAIQETTMATFPASAATSYTLTGLTAGTQYTCRTVVEINGYTDNNTQTVSFIPLGIATQLVYTSQPASSQAGVALPIQPVVAIKDANGNTITAGPDSTASITLTISTASVNPGGTVRGTATVNAIGGVATFAGLNIQEIGNKTLTAVKPVTAGSGQLTQDSSSFVISAGPVSPMTSTIAINPAVPPSTALVADGNAAYSVIMTLKDQYGNPVTGIKPQFTSNISGDTLSQSTSATDMNGQATGSISSTIADEQAPYRALSISSPSGLTGLTVAAPFLPGAATKLGFTVQPANSPGGLLGMSTVKIAVQDVNGNIVNTGTGATAAVTMTIASNVNGATLSGTTTVNAVNGIATFSNLGIDKTATGYKLLASSGNYSPAYSNTFNITAGVPQKIAITGATSVYSASCSAAITVQLQDAGGNPSNAIQNTPLTISGLGSAGLYTSSACSGTPVAATLTFTAGTSTKVLYLKDLAAEAVNLSIRDSSNVLTTGTRTISVSPDKVTLTAAMPSPPASPGTTMSVVAGVCSPPILVTPQGDNGNAGPLFNLTPVYITGLSGTSAVIYMDAACTQAVTAGAVTLPITSTGTTYPIKIYLMDPKAEALQINVSDPSAVMTTMSTLQTVNILPSAITFTGPTSVVAGKCSTAFNITLKDAQGNAVTALSDTVLNINGLAGSATGKFYTNAACTGTTMTSSVTIPQGSSSVGLYFSDVSAESLNIFISDPAALMSNSATIAIGISPAAYAITGPSPTTSATGVCAGPFSVNTMDGSPTPKVTAAIAPLVANLSTSGYAAGFSTAAAFYSDSACSNSITNLNFSSGVSSQQFYFIGNYPITTLTFNATDPANVLTTGTKTWTITSAKGWLGTLGQIFDSLGNFLWFRTGVKPVSARLDGASTVRNLHFDSTKQFLYVADQNGARVLKYDYLNKKYIGWIGQFNNPNNASVYISGSNQASYPSLPSPAQCVSTTHWNPTPGWCVGGQAGNVNPATSGGMWVPQGLTDDGTYLYVVENNGHSVNRYVAASGAFAGWIGGISSTPTAFASGGPASCTSTSTGPTPGWCVGGGNAANTSGTTGWGYGTGSMFYPQAVTTDGSYLYVGNSGAVLRYTLSTGAFAGWIGKGYNTSPTSGTAGCTSLANGQTTPGWCSGGTYQQFCDQSHMKAGGICNPQHLLIVNGLLYVVDSNAGSVITTFNVSTGAFVQVLPNLAYNWASATSMTYDQTTNLFYVGDYSRVLAIDNTGLVQGWMGKVSNTSGLSSALGNTNDCSSLAVNSNTPGWCLGGSYKAGMDETAFERIYGIENDGQGNILVGQFDNPTIKIFNMSTGAYGGALTSSSAAPTSWSTDATKVADGFGFGDGDYYAPQGTYSDGTYLYVADAGNARIKKINLSNGSLVGWIGGATTVPTGGTTAGCLTMNPMSVTPGWCTGALPNPWVYAYNFINSSSMAGIMEYPNGITGDGTYLYVVDQYLHRISKFNASTGAYVGWVGDVSTTPSGGATGCTSAASGTFTPGWCIGGTSQSGTGNGMLNTPTGITYMASTGNLYVIDASNQRVSSYNASTGAFNGWIGRTNTAPSSGCSPASNGSYTVSATGWCLGGTSQAGSGPGDRGGGFSFWTGGTNSGGITTDGTYLYVANFWNSRIDKFSTNGVWLGATQTRWDQYTNVWTSTPATVGGWSPGCAYPAGIYTDGTYIYGTGHQDCNTGWGYRSAVFKLKISTGSVYGWQGAIVNAPANGDAGCPGANTTTPGWCQGGGSTQNYHLGQFSDVRNVTGDAYYVYFSDFGNHRITRIPK